MNTKTEFSVKIRRIYQIWKFYFLLKFQSLTVTEKIPLHFIHYKITSSMGPLTISLYMYMARADFINCNG